MENVSIQLVVSVLTGVCYPDTDTEFNPAAIKAVSTALARHDTPESQAIQDALLVELAMRDSNNGITSPTGAYDLATALLDKRIYDVGAPLDADGAAAIARMAEYVATQGEFMPPTPESEMAENAQRLKRCFDGLV